MEQAGYIQRHPHEIFRVPDKTNPASAVAALLAFAAYPHESEMIYRKEAYEALHAWLFRRAREQGNKVKAPQRLTRKSLSTRVVENRVFKASRRFEFEAMPLVGLAMELWLRKAGGHYELAKLWGAALGADKVEIRIPKGYERENTVFLEYLTRFRSKSELIDKDQALGDFRRRKWNKFLPCMPLLTALHVDVLRYDVERQTYNTQIPGWGRRYLLISLLHNPDLWLDKIVQETAERRTIYAMELGEHTFPEILGEGEAYSIGR